MNEPIGPLIGHWGIFDLDTGQYTQLQKIYAGYKMDELDFRTLATQIQWQIGNSKVDTIKYNQTNAIQPEINQQLNTPLNFPTVLRLYFPPTNRSVEFNNIHTLFDLLGAINTYYIDQYGNPNRARKVLERKVNFGGLMPYENGYGIRLG